MSHTGLSCSSLLFSQSCTNVKTVLRPGAVQTQARARLWPGAVVYDFWPPTQRKQKTSSIYVFIWQSNFSPGRTVSSEKPGKKAVKTGKMGLSAELESQSPGGHLWGPERSEVPQESRRHVPLCFSDAFPATHRTMAYRVTEALKFKVSIWHCHLKVSIIVWEAFTLSTRETSFSLSVLMLFSRRQHFASSSSVSDHLLFTASFGFIS